MKLNRRNTIIGLGTIVAGGGAALGTGAFSQVDAERQITIDVDEDEDAFVSITPHEDTDLVTADGGELVIEWDEDDFGGSGAHQNATITVENAIVFEHNGDADDTYEVDISGDELDGDADIEFTGVSTPFELEDGDDETAGLEITTADEDIDGETFTIEITAD